MNRFTRPRFSVTAARTILLFAATLFVGHTSRADSMDSWPIKFHPHLDLASTYDDNILISHDRPLADVYFTVSPGLELDYGDKAHNFLSLDYTAGIVRYLQHGSQDADNNFVTLKGEFTFDHLKLQISHAFRDETTSNVEVGNRVHEEQNLTDASAEYLLNRFFSVGLLYHQEFHHFLTAGQIDNSLFEPGVAVYYHLLSKADLFTEFDYGWVDVQEGENQTFENISMGIRGKITAKISGRVAVGYENRDYSGLTHSTETETASVSLHGDFTKHTSADLTILREITPSVTTEDISYTASRVEFTVSEKLFMEKVLATAGGAYEYDDYHPNEQRLDNVWQAHVGARYIATKRLDVGVKYTYQRDLSDVGTFSFSENTVSVDALLHF
jgi:hypothetical protein